MYVYEYQKEWQYLTNVCFNITDDCNLACRYCFVEQHPHFMELDTAKKAVDWLYNNYQKKLELNIKDKPYINFFGGEPMLLYEKIIQPVVIYAEENYPNIFGFGMTTNGTLLNEQRLQWLFDHHFHLLLSIDGLPETQNYNRPCKNENINSFDLVYKNIPKLLELFPNTTFRATIFQDTAKNTLDNYLFAEQLGFKSTFFAPNCRGQWTESQINDLLNCYDVIFNIFYDKIRHGVMPVAETRIKDSFKYIQRFYSLASKREYPDRSNIIYNPNRCGLGTTLGSIGYDGNIYGCQEQNSKSEKNIFLIGNIEDGIDLHKHTILTQTYAYTGSLRCENREICTKCCLKSMCDEPWCPSTCFDIYNDFSIRPTIICVLENFCFNKGQEIYNLLYNQNNSLFLQFLNNI